MFSNKSGLKAEVFQGKDKAKLKSDIFRGVVQRKNLLVVVGDEYFVESHNLPRFSEFVGGAPRSDGVRGKVGSTTDSITVI